MGKVHFSVEKIQKQLKIDFKIIMRTNRRVGKYSKYSIRGSDSNEEVGDDSNNAGSTDGESSKNSFDGDEDDEKQ